MIEYDPNGNRLRDILHLGSSWTMRGLAGATLAAGVYAVAMSVLILQSRLEGRRPISGTFSLLGIILSIVLASRINTAYDRWWGARKLWGSIVNSSRNLAIQLDSPIAADDREETSAFAALIASFAPTLSGHLRGDPGPLDDTVGEDGDETVQAVSHAPARLAKAIIRRVGELRQSGLSAGPGVLALTIAHALVDSAGACERIRRAPIPSSSSVFIKLFLLSYAAVLPLGLAPEHGYLSVPLVMLIIFALLGLELMASEIEDPFGRNCDDLPTETLAELIRVDAAACNSCHEAGARKDYIFSQHHPVLRAAAPQSR